jgi:hypothetical protein
MKKQPLYLSCLRQLRYSQLSKTSGLPKKAAGISAAAEVFSAVKGSRGILSCLRQPGYSQLSMTAAGTACCLISSITAELSRQQVDSQLSGQLNFGLNIDLIGRARNMLVPPLDVKDVLARLLQPVRDPVLLPALVLHVHLHSFQHF